MLDSGRKKKMQGFSLLELLIVIGMMTVLAAVAVPQALIIISDMNVRYAATNLNGLLQSARMEAIRKNLRYEVQPTSLSNGQTAYYVHKSGGAYSAGDTLLPIDGKINISIGSGSGAPNESTFLTGLGFNTYPSGENPSFNARGLPCYASGGACPQSNLGFVYFLAITSFTGNTSWASVVITPAGRVQIWTADTNGNWVQRN